MQDPLSLLWVPEHCVSPLFLLLQRCQAMKSAVRILSNYVEKTVKEREKLRNMQSVILEEVRKMKERLAHRVRLQETGESGVWSGSLMGRAVRGSVGRAELDVASRRVLRSLTPPPGLSCCVASSLGVEGVCSV